MTDFHHVGVRGHPSGIWHYAQPCGHRVHPTSAATQRFDVQYNSGPLWKDGYTWQNIFWGTFPTGWMDRVQQATINLEADPSYSLGLSQYRVGVGKVNPNYIVIGSAPPQTLPEEQIKMALSGWISANTVPDFQGKGAYNIFLQGGIVASLDGDQSCSVWCDYHDTVDGSNGPFFTVEPFPCSIGCNQCTNDDFDTLTQGLSEEMVELKTDMNPGTGWVVGNLELCDVCDQNFVCNQISTGEFVNAWYNNQTKACWIGGKRRGITFQKSV